VEGGRESDADPPRASKVLVALGGKDQLLPPALTGVQDPPIDRDPQSWAPPKAARTAIAAARPYKLQLSLATLPTADNTPMCQ